MLTIRFDGSATERYLANLKTAPPGHPTAT